jgi:hypothetical protein
VRPLTIPTAELLPPDVPVLRDACDPAWQELALTYPGYAAHADEERFAAICNRELERWRSGSKVEAPLLDLRARLFYEQRREHFAGGWGDPNLYAAALVEAIREAVDRGVEDIDDPAGTGGLFPVALGATSARDAKWWEVSWNLPQRFHGECAYGQGLWLTRRHGRPWLLATLGEEEETCAVLPFTSAQEIERFIRTGSNLSPLEED